MAMFMNPYPNNPKMKEWLLKDEDERDEIAEKNEWSWRFLWGDISNQLRYEYEKVDKSPNVHDKYGGYDGLDKKPKEGEEYAPCTNKECPYYNTTTWGEHIYKGANCSYWGDTDRMFECSDELFVLIQQWIDVCGIEELDTLQKAWNIHPDIIGWFKYGDDYFKDKEGYNMKENMKYIYEEGKLINGYRIIKKIDEGHDAGAVLLNQNNCKKFDLIDDTLTNIENVKKYDTCETNYFDIIYIKTKIYANNKITEETLEGKITIEREGYDFVASNENEDKLWFHVDILTELEVHFKDDNYKHLKCWGLIDNDEESLVVYDPKKEIGDIMISDKKKELALEIESLKEQLTNLEEQIHKKEQRLEDIYDIREGIQWIDVKYDKRNNSAYLYFYAEDCGDVYKIVEFPNVPEEFASNTYKKLNNNDLKLSVGDYDYI